MAQIGEVTIPVDIGKVMRDQMTLTARVELRGMRLARVRIWLGSKIILFAASVMGVGVKIETDSK